MSIRQSYWQAWPTWKLSSEPSRDIHWSLTDVTCVGKDWRGCPMKEWIDLSWNTIHLRIQALQGKQHSCLIQPLGMKSTGLSEKEPGGRDGWLEPLSPLLSVSTLPAPHTVGMWRGRWNEQIHLPDHSPKVSKLKVKQRVWSLSLRGFPLSTLAGSPDSLSTGLF